MHRNGLKYRQVNWVKQGIDKTCSRWLLVFFIQVTLMETMSPCQTSSDRFVVYVTLIFAIFHCEYKTQNNWFYPVHACWHGSIFVTITEKYPREWRGQGQRGVLGDGWEASWKGDIEQSMKFSKDCVCLFLPSTRNSSASLHKHRRALQPRDAQTACTTASLPHLSPGDREQRIRRRAVQIQDSLHPLVLVLNTRQGCTPCFSFPMFSVLAVWNDRRAAEQGQALISPRKHLLW